MGKSEEQNPPAYSLRISENALRNLNEITGYTALIRHQPLNAIRVGEKFFETFKRIEKITLHFVNVKKLLQAKNLS